MLGCFPAPDGSLERHDMRLSNEYIDEIKSQAARQFGDGVDVYLFGSRVDDDKKGGDIDLLLELSRRPDDLAQKITRLNGALQLKLGLQKIDIVVHTPGQPRLPIHAQAKQHGVLL